MDDQFVEEVLKLKEQGLSERQMAVQLQASRSKVHSALEKLKQSTQSTALVPEDNLRAVIREELERARAAENAEDKTDGAFPVMRKMGGGIEAIAPEAVLRHYMGGTPEGDLELRAIMKFRAAMLMVMDLVNIQKGSAEADARRLEPILRLMKETREEQDAAAARAKASSDDIADRAAQETAGHLLGAMGQNQSQVTGSLDQIRQMLSGKNDDPFSRMVGMMQSMQQMSQMFGMPLPGGMGMPMGGLPGGPNAGVGTAEPPPIEKHSKEDWEERNV